MVEIFTEGRPRAGGEENKAAHERHHKPWGGGELRKEETLCLSCIYGSPTSC
jgi:hypothetical protein